MKRNRRNILKREWFGIMVVALCIYACANRGYPEGGPKDETPPQVVEEVPLSYTTNFKAKNLADTMFRFNAKDFPNAEVIDLR